MRVTLGLKPDRVELPGLPGCYVELKKLGGPGRADWKDLAGANASTRCRFIWDRAVVGYKLPGRELADGRPGFFEWPVERDQRDTMPTPDEVYAGLDDDLFAWLFSAFNVHNEFIDEPWLTLHRWGVTVGFENLPDAALEALAQEKPAEAILEQARAALGSSSASMGETLGNLAGSSAGNSAAGGSPTSETASPSPAS